MCISEEKLNKTIVAIREFKSIKKDAETNLKPLEQEVKEFMEETNQTSGNVKRDGNSEIIWEVAKIWYS